MKIFHLPIIFITTALVSCSDLNTTQITGKYYLTTTSGQTASDVSYSLGGGSFVGVVDPGVIRVGFDSKHMLVVQRTDSVDNYYIIPFEKPVNKSPDENKIGPLNKEDFRMMQKELGISSEIKLVNVDEIK